MALTIIATPGASNANSYCTLAEADTYHESVIAAHATDWSGASDTTQNESLAMATRYLDALYEWAQWASETTQALQWPRRGVLDHLKLSTIAEDVVPQIIKNATAEFARQLIAEDRSADSDVERYGLTSLRAGSVSLSFKDGVVARPVPDAVAVMIPAWWGYVRGMRPRTRRLVRA